MNDIKMREGWNTRLGFVMATIGSAIGLGNIWRFPYICYKNGGGAFLIPYVIALLVVGIPLMMLEQGMGHRFQGAFPKSAASVNRRWEVLGWWTVIVAVFGILLYYNVVLSWCVNYLWYALSLAWGEGTQDFFHHTFLGLTSGPFDIGGLQWAVTMGSILVWFVNWWIVSRGVGKGIERINMIMMPLLFLEMIILVIWSLTLPGASVGVKAYLTPNPERLADPQTWIDAFSHIFFTLSLGMGAMVAYASYLRGKVNIASNSVISCFANCGFEVFAGFAVFATLGYMASQTGVAVADVATQGPGLAFVTYPKVINLLPFGRHVFGILFFSALIFAGITSSISLLEAFSSAVMDKFGFTRGKIVAWTSVGGVIGSLVFSTGAGLYWLDIVDHFISNVALLGVGLLEAILIAYVFGSGKMAVHIREHGGLPLAWFWKWCIGFIAPLFLLVLLGAETWKNLTTPYGGYSWAAVVAIGVGWLVVTFAAAVVVTRRSWTSSVSFDRS